MDTPSPDQPRPDTETPAESIHRPAHPCHETLSHPDTPASSGSVSEPDCLARIGRYRVDKLLGRGGFGVVYLAFDTTLGRQVAIKLPHRHRVSTPTQAEAYLKEARIAAQLLHANIVPVYDVGTTDQFPFFVVTQFVAGGDLATRLEKGPLATREAIRIASDVAGALDHAHRHGLVHRDIKPANIFLDANGRAHVGDFGLALSEQDIGTGPRHAGTPQYMSPEQARGEGHRVDGRSDIFSLGVVLYEMLTGKRPFRASSMEDLLEEIISFEARPPRQARQDVPREVERICLKALSKRVADRHTTASDLAAELEACLVDKSPSPGYFPGGTPAGSLAPTPNPGSATHGRRFTIVPKGLRSFDDSDRDFFLDLIPGPRDRDGLPEGIRFWKGRLEEDGVSDPMQIGLVYGPSGCGKSSLVKAGLLPRLAPWVRTLYLEATGSETEPRILAGLRRIIPELPAGLALAETFQAVRRGILPKGCRRLVVFIDQFEQWLHARGANSETGLARALRQCDGERLQAVVMVRDDFWLAVSRFLADLEVPLREGVNARMVDLFDLGHARKVLSAYGKAYGALPPESAGEEDPELAGVLSRAETWPDLVAEARDGVRRAVDIADRDPEMALARVRKVFARLVREVYETRMEVSGAGHAVAALMDRIVKEGHFPLRLEARARAILAFGTMGDRGSKESPTVADVKEALALLEPIVAWRCGASTAAATVPRVTRGSDAAGHDAFIAQAVGGLARDGKVIPVQIALLAEILKDKPWVPDTLKALGGVEGIGMAFLEETFSAPTAPPAHRSRQRSVRAVLQALLPPPGTDIKGHMRSREELFQVSGLAGRPREFDDLLVMLDAQLRLITPTDPEGACIGAGGTEARPQYILTHDYLVPSLRDWLARMKRETSRGRAELMLAERAAAWQANTVARQLPYLFEWVGILRHVPRRSWSAQERRMMARAFRIHGLRVVAAGVLAALGIGGALVIRNQFSAERNAGMARGLVDSLVRADMSRVPGIIQDLGPYRRWSDPLLRLVVADPGTPANRKLKANLALLPIDSGQADAVLAGIAVVEPREVRVLVEALHPVASNILDRLWAMASGPGRLRAAAALAQLDPEGARWKELAPGVVADLVRENPVHLGAWADMLNPVINKLLEPLTSIFRDPRSDRLQERLLATNLLAEWASDNPALLADLVMDADARQFESLFPPLAVVATEAAAVLSKVVGEKTPEALSMADPKRETLALRKANAAVALLRLGHEREVWPLLRHSRDPRVRSYLVHRLAALGADPEAVVLRLKGETEITIKRALALALGEFGEMAVSPAQREKLLPMVRALFRDESDPGMHAAAEWLLRQWKQHSWVKMEYSVLAGDTRRRDAAYAATLKPAALPAWTVNSKGQPFTLIPGPVEFQMGSPRGEEGRFINENMHLRKIPRSFAVASRPVTLSEYRKLTGDRTQLDDQVSYSDDLPAVGLNWHMSARYCNLLSKAEGIPETQWCFEIIGPNSEDIKLKKGFLGLAGYRMPTEAEMEYSTRAGAETSRYFGESGALLSKYDWFNLNSNVKLQPVGMLKPNDLGLFDMQGNCFNWCLDSGGGIYPFSLFAVIDNEKVVDGNYRGTRVLRGGAYLGPALDARSAGRAFANPDVRLSYHGLRPARTIVP